MIKKLMAIQNELKAPKGQYNDFGKYKYRSCEDILEAVKPLLAKHKCSLTLSDSIELIGERYYVKATATIYDVDSDKSYSVTAWARESEDKKGQDASQITGTASSYARKYALNGLFCIDDTKDADTNEYAEKTKGGEERPKAKKAPAKKSNAVTNRDKVIIYAQEHNIPMGELAKDYGLSGNTTDERFAEVLADLEGRK